MLFIASDNLWLRRTIKYSLLVCSSILLLGFGFWIARPIVNPVVKKKTITNGAISGLKSYESMQIDGLKFSHFEGQRKVWACSAERMSLEKAKTGHFRVAFMRDAFFQKVAMDFYLKGTDTEDAEVILQSLLVHLRAKSFKRFSIQEFTVTIHTDDNILSVLHSSEASIDSAGHSMILNGNVTIAVTPSIGKILRCSSLKWTGSTLQVDGSYSIFEVQGKTVQGENLKADISLASFEGGKNQTKYP